MKRILVAGAAVLILILPVVASAHSWRNHRGPQGSHKPPVVSPAPPVVTPPSVPTPPTVPTPPVVSVNSFTLGAFNANVGTVQVEFVDITDLYVPSSNKQLFVYLENNRTSNSDIAGGKYDSQLKSWASKLPPNTIVSFGHEMNLTENPWGGNPTTFKSAYIHVYGLLHPYAKVAFVGNNSDTPGTPQIGQYWPGAQYVDLVGEDGFDWGGESLSQSLQPNFAILKAYATGNGKPLWVTSTGTASNQASWITTGLSWAKANGVSGLLYFSYDDGGNFQLTSSGLAALK